MQRLSIADVARAVGLALIPVLAGFWGLDSLATHHGDESAYIDVAVHMRESGNYLVPVYHAQLLLDKPPLYYWLVVLSFRVFGISLFAARLPALLGVGLIVALVYWFTLRVYSSVRGAVYAALAVASCTLTCWIGRLAVPDTIMTVGSLLTVAGYYLATTAQPRIGYLLLASFGLGIAGMAKGHVGMVVALLPPIVVVGLVDRRMPAGLRLRDLAAPWTWLPAAVLCGSWYIYLLSSHQPVIELAPLHSDAEQTVSAALIQFMQREVEHQVSEGWRGLFDNLRKYGSGFFVWFFPWTTCILAGFFLRPRPFWLDWKEYHRITAILVTCIASTMVLFTAIVLERGASRYLLPITPAVGILAGRFFVRRETARQRRRVLSIPVLVSAVLLLINNAFFGAFLPRAVRPPLESVCAALHPRLGADDVVLTAALDDKWATFAMALLGRGVVSVQSSRETEGLEGRIDAHLSDNPVHGGTAVYLITTAEAAQSLAAHDPQRFRLLDPGAAGWLAEERQLFEHFVLIEVRSQGERAGEHEM